MNPVIGPINVSKSSGGTSRSWLKQQLVYKQAKPYNLMLPYRGIYHVRVSTAKGVPWNAGNYGGSSNSPVSFDTTGDPYYAYYEAYANQCIAKCIKKFNKLQGERASLGIALVQHREAIDMITKRAKQCLDLFRAVKRFDLKAASRVLGLDLFQAKRRHREWIRVGKRGPYSLSNEDIWSKDWANVKSRQRSKAAADLWLEFSFGWAPLVDDVSTAIKVINDRPYYVTPFKTGATEDRVLKIPTSSTSEFFIQNTTCDHTLKFRCSVGGTLTVTNSNYNLLSSLGLTNLKMVVYEGIPFSFVANYFVNIEEYLQQSTQYDGVTVSQAWWTIVWDDTADCSSTTTYRPTGVVTVNSADVKRSVSTKRTVGSLPEVKLGLRSSYHNGIKRALNNVSLLVGLMNKR